jgi:YfdX protein
MRRIDLALAALGAAVLVAGAAPRAASAAQETVLVETNTLTADQKVFVSKKGGEVASHIEKALKLTGATTDRVAAKLEVGSALAILGGIDHVSVATRIHNEIDKLLHKTQTKKAKATDLLPVMGVLDEAKDVQGLGVEEARVSLNRAKQKLAKGATVEAEADIIEASEAVSYLQIDLPIHATKERLERAMYYLTQNPPDMPNANAALKDALKHTKEFTAMASGTAVEEGVGN